MTSIERDADIYIARDDRGAILWSIEISLDMSGTPFREEVVWPAASAVVVAGGPTVHFLSVASGELLKTLPLDDDYFGNFGPTDGDVLHILGWRHVTAVDATLAIRGVSRDVAVDGITGGDLHGDRIHISAEMDPPGGWVEVELDALSGRELRRGLPE